MKRFTSAEQAFEFYYERLNSYGYDELRNNTRTCFNESFELAYPDKHVISTPWRKWSLSYAHREWLWYMSGSRSIEEIKEYGKIWDKMHNGDGLVWSNYGYWWQRNNQLEKVINLLREDHLTRRAVILHYDVDKIDEYKFDTPCNICLNFYVSSGTKLNLTIFARSIDIWYGFCNDQYQFSKLMMYVAGELNLQMGSMFFHITNLHLYNNQINKNK